MSTQQATKRSFFGSLFSKSLRAELAPKWDSTSSILKGGLRRLSDIQERFGCDPSLILELRDQIDNPLPECIIPALWQQRFGTTVNPALRIDSLTFLSDNPRRHFGSHQFPGDFEPGAKGENLSERRIICSSHAGRLRDLKHQYVSFCCRSRRQIMFDIIRIGVSAYWLLLIKSTDA